MIHKQHEIWKVEETTNRAFPWRAQMTNYVAQFETEEQAKRYVSAIQKIAEDARKRGQK